MNEEGSTVDLTKLQHAVEAGDTTAVLATCAAHPTEAVLRALLFAAKAGKTPLLAMLLEEFKEVVGVSSRVSEGFREVSTALHEAAAEGHVDASRFLLDRGANLAAKTRYGDSPLHVAVKKSYHELTKLFLERGADPNAFSDIGCSSMHVVQDPETARLLLAHGANPNAKLDSEYGWPPLRFTDRGLDTCRVLVEHGADLNLKDKAGRTPLFWVSRLDVAQYFVEHGADVCCVASNGVTPLHAFAYGNSAAMCTLLLERGALVDAQDKDGNTPLLIHCAIHATREVCELLVQHGADVNARNKKGETPLLLAARMIGPLALATCEFLVEHGANVNAATDAEQTTPLLAAESFAVFAYLLESGKADLVATTATKETALHRLLRIYQGYDMSPEDRAVETQLCIRCCRLLVESGKVDVNAPDEDGVTPLHLVQTIDVCEVLLQAGADARNKISQSERTPLHTYLSDCPDPSFALVKALVEAGADATAKDQSGRTPLQMLRRNVHAAKLLLERGASVHERTKQQRTPLMERSEEGDVDMCRFILDWGADVNAADEEGMTALHVSRTNEVCVLLLRRGANVNAVSTNSARTPLHELLRVKGGMCGHFPPIIDHQDGDDTFEKCWTMVVTFGADPTFGGGPGAETRRNPCTALKLARRYRQEHSRVVQLLVRARELRVMVCLLSTRWVSRLRVGNACVLHMLPADVMRELRGFLWGEGC